MYKKTNKTIDEINSKKNELRLQLEKMWGEIETTINEKESSFKKNFTDFSNSVEKNIVPLGSNIGDLKEYYSRMVSDIKESKFSTTDYNPSKDEIDTLGRDIDVVISCRGNKELKNLYPTHVSNIEEILKGSLEECRGGKVVFYIHGYNVNRTIALEEANNLFKKLRKDVKGYKFVLFTWPGDSGLLKFRLAQNYAEYSGELLYKVVRRLKDEYLIDDSILIAHSLGSHVALRSASLMGIRERYKNVLLLGPAINENILSKNNISNKYWYPNVLDKIDNLDIVYSKTDITLEVCFSIYELGKPLGSNVSKYKNDIRVRMHDLTPMNGHMEGIAVNSHLQYWETDEQIELYKRLLFSKDEHHYFL